MASYLVIEGEQVNQNTIHNQCFIVEANSSQEAKQFFIRKVGIHDRLFLEDVYNRSINMGLVEHFGYDLLSWQGVPKPRYEKDKMDELFKNRVRELFEDHHEWAETYIEHMLYEKDIEFPEEMLAYLYYELEYRKIIVIPINEIKRF